MAHNRKILTAFANATTGADVIAAPGAGLKVYVVSYVITEGAAAGTVKFTSGAGPTDISATYHLPVNGVLAVSGDGDEGRILETNAPNEKLSIVASAAVDVTVRYYISQGV